MSEITPLLQHRVMQLFEDKLGIEVPSADADLFGSGVLDSLAFVNLLLNIENEFGITVTLETVELENFQSINAITGFILAHSHELREGGTGGPHTSKTSVQAFGSGAK